MLGLRLVFVHGPSAGWLDDGTADWIWPAAASAGVPIAVLAPGKTAAIGAVAEAHPGLKLVVDHLNIPTGHPKDQPLEKLVGEVLELASLPNVAVKASALPFFTLSSYPFPDLRKVMQAVVEGFGARRVFWGSDLSRLPCGYEELVRFFGNLNFMSQSDRQLVLGEGLRQWLAWET
jgi:predicted TIM-barrel fold metal-dependent hydrolase